MEKQYKIAGLITALFCSGRTEKQAIPYLCASSEPAEIRISSDEVTRIRKIWKQESPDVSDDMLDYQASGALFYKALLEHNGLMLHASAVVKDGKAYLFTADPGTGKSTHASLWLQIFEGSFILNDDKPAIRYMDGCWYAYGTPWSGKNDLSKNTCAPIAGIAVLEQSTNNEIVPFDGISAIEAILRQVNRPNDAMHRILLMELLDKLLTQVPVWKLRCNMDPTAAIVAHDTMSKT